MLRLIPHKKDSLSMLRICYLTTLQYKTKVKTLIHLNYLTTIYWTGLPLAVTTSLAVFSLKLRCFVRSIFSFWLILDFLITGQLGYHHRNESISCSTQLYYINGSFAFDILLLWLQWTKMLFHISCFLLIKYLLIHGFLGISIIPKCETGFDDVKMIRK